MKNGRDAALIPAANTSHWEDAAWNGDPYGRGWLNQGMAETVVFCYATNPLLY